MVAALDDLPGLHHQNLVRIDHRRQAVRDHQGSFVLRHIGQFGLDGAFIGRVQRRGSFIKHQNRWVLEQGAGNGHALLFATRQFQTALAHRGLVALGRGSNEIVDAGRTRSTLNLGLAGPGTAIGDVVGHAVVEQHRVLWHDAQGLAHARLSDLPNVLPRNADEALLHVVKTKHQARQRGLARARRADHRHGFAGRNREADVFQNRAIKLISKRHAVKHHIGCALQGQGVGTRRIGHFALAVHQHKHLVQIGQALLDLAVKDAQKVEWNVELDHEGVDHDQIAQSHAPGHHAFGGTPEHGYQGRRNDELLPGVEHRQRGLCLQTRQAQALEAFVVATRLESLIAKIFDGFVVQERVNRSRMGSRIELIGLLAELGAPFGHANGEENIKHQGCQRDACKPSVELDGQNGQHQAHLNQGRDDAVKRIGNQRLDAAHASLDVARHAAGLPRQMKAQT